ncbi:MAG: response regulator transcription factor [Treponema sp.]|jgi:two-component system alkaline phosphatase synthesis response regulator PhoP|nr:response regulator transcription factor [Treponema sp.]
MHKIFVVEDDDNIRELLMYALTQSGFDVSGYADGRLFYAALNAALNVAASDTKTPDLILLDIMLPGEDGISLLKKMRGSGKTEKIPIIMLTAKGAEHDRVKGLDLGADDYITKPFSVVEVVARIRAVLRRSASKTDALSDLAIGGAVGVALSPHKRAVYVNGTEIAVTYKEFELLQYLMRKKGVVLTREAILNRVWGSDYLGDSRTVDMHIKSLRQKLGEAGRVIKTVRNVGYKIEDEV